MLGYARMPVEKGSAIYVPKGVWHGVENPDSELLLLWVVAPLGLEEFFVRSERSRSAAKATHSRPIDDIARKHGMQVKEREVGQTGSERRGESHMSHMDYCYTKMA